MFIKNNIGALNIGLFSIAPSSSNVMINLIFFKICVNSLQRAPTFANTKLGE